MTDESIYTGPLPTQITGDIALGKTYAREGRRMLGAMLGANGVNERIANGEPGGFFKRSVQMEDGTVVTVTTNDGFHVLRIDAPRTTGQTESRPEYHSATGSSPHYVFEPGAEGSSPPPEVPLPGFPEREEVEEGEEPRKEGSEYMWVGCRYTTPNVSFLVLGAMMIEPDSGPMYGTTGMPRRGIIDGIAWWSYGVLETHADGKGEFEVYPETDPGALNTVDECIEAIYEAYRYFVDNPWGHDYAQTHIIHGTHAIEVTVNPTHSETPGGYFYHEDGTFLISANGLRCESIHMWHIESDPTFCGYDPMASDQTGIGVRVVGNRHDNPEYYHGQLPFVLWDHVFTLDPHEDDKVFPYDDRPQMPAIRRALERAGMTTQILPGEYILALHSIDTTPGIRSRRAGEVIPLFEDEAEDTGLPYRSGHSDYDEYMEPYGSTNGLGVEVEVRLGKGNQASIYHFETTIAESSDEYFTTMPYGMDWHEACDPIGGPNPAGPNFAPSYIAINPLAGSARWVGKGEIDLYPILGGGVYSHKQDHRHPLDIYVHVVPWSQPEQSEWAEYVGNALFRVLEAATAGVYGAVVIHDPGGEAGCMEIFEGSSRSQLWKYDATEQTLTPLPVLGKMEDYPYGWQPDETMPDGGFMSPYIPEMFWYYPYKYLSKADCRYSIAIGITAVKGTFHFDHGQHTYFKDPPVETDCC